MRVVGANHLLLLARRRVQGRPPPQNPSWKRPPSHWRFLQHRHRDQNVLRSVGGNVAGGVGKSNLGPRTDDLGTDGSLWVSSDD